MSEYLPEPERPQELTEPVFLGSVIREMVVGDAFDGSQEENEAVRKRSVDIVDVQSEIASLWEDWEKATKERSSAETFDDIKSRLLGAQARLIDLELVQSEIAALWKARNKITAGFEDTFATSEEVAAIDQRLLGAQARRLKLGRPEGLIEP